MIYLPCISSLYLVYHDISTLCIISVSYDIPSCIDIYLVYHDISTLCIIPVWYDLPSGIDMYLVYHDISTSCIICVWYDLPSDMMSTWFIMIYLHVYHPCMIWSTFSYWYLLGISLYIFILYHPCMIWPTFSYRGERSPFLLLKSDFFQCYHLIG